MKPLANAFWALAAVAVISGCASSVPLEDKPPVESRTPTGVGQGGAGAGTGGAAQSQVTTVDLARSTAEAASKAGRVVYFDYDSYVVKDEFRPLIDAHAKALVADRKRRVTLEGHTDERGGREYNLALGQKRAEAVLKSLVLLGSNEGQLEAVSYGKERPAVSGSDEAAWAKNRRVELNPK